MCTAGGGWPPGSSVHSLTSTPRAVPSQASPVLTLGPARSAEDGLGEGISLIGRRGKCMFQAGQDEFGVYLFC